MSKKIDQENDGFILDINTPDTKEDKAQIEGNKKALSLFGKRMSGSGSQLLQMLSEKKNTSPLEQLKKRMGVSSNAAPKTDENTAGSITEQEKAEIKIEPRSPSPEAAEPEITKETPVNVSDAAPTPDNNKDDAGELSLLEKLKRYTTDETGHDVTEDKAPLYKLQSVAEIIKKDSNKIIDKLSEKYDVTVDTLGKPQKDDYLLEGIDEEPPAQEKEDTEKAVTPAFEEMATESKKRFEKSIFDELFPQDKKPPESSTDSIPDISDIDNSHLALEEPVEPEEAESLADTATIRFTPVADQHGNTGSVNISSTTKPIDIRQELTKADETDSTGDTAPKMSEFDFFLPKTEVTDLTGAKSTVRKLSYKKRRGFLTTALCALCAFIISLFLLPVLSDKTISSTKTVLAICTVSLFISFAANYDMFTDLLGVLKRRASHDCVMSLCALLCAPLCIYAVILGENTYHTYHIILLAALLMFVRSLVAFMHNSLMLSNLKQIVKNAPKYGVSFINDSTTTRAIAKDSIEGDVLIAAPRKAEFVSDYMKFSLFKKKFSGKMPVVFIVVLILAALGAAISGFYYKTPYASLYTAAATAVIAGMPALCFIDTLPLFFAARRLNKKGAMIAGTFGADSIELANAVVADTADIFPRGSLKLKSLKVLSNNNIDKTIVNAAALTEAIGSPLFPVFNQIAGSSTAYEKPDYDTIKYEKRLGLSGWVDNELLFIGNYSLMKGHGIEVPSIEVDRHILKSGCFPVYVATGGKACALLSIEYEVQPDIQRLLRKISRLGITMLINNCDPNINEKMLCDNFGLYDDSVKIMSNAGAYMCKNATADTSTMSAPAAFRGNKLNLLRIMCAASGIRISNKILSVLYILSAITGIWYFVFTSFTQSAGLLSGSAILLFELIATAISIIAFLFRKP